MGSEVAFADGTALVQPKRSPVAQDEGDSSSYFTTAPVDDGEDQAKAGSRAFGNPIFQDGPQDAAATLGNAWFVNVSCYVTGLNSNIAREEEHPANTSASSHCYCQASDLCNIL